MPVTSNNSSHYFDYDKFREAVKAEKEIRNVTITSIADAIGMHVSQLTAFLNDDRGTIGSDFVASLLVWLGVKFEKFVIARRPIAKHVDNDQHRQVRVAQAFLKRNDFEAIKGETAVETMMRLIRLADEKGVFDE